MLQQEPPMSDSRRLHAGADTLARSGPPPGAALYRPAVAPVLFLVAISLAEVTTVVVNPRAGLVGHALILFGLLFYGARTRDESRRALFWGLSLVPLIRLLSLSLPLAGFPVLYWYAIISVPVSNPDAAARSFHHRQYSNRQARSCARTRRTRTRYRHTICSMRSSN